VYFPSIPISYSIELTYACNNTCPGCANILNSQHSVLLSEWKTLFDRIAPVQNRRQYADLIRLTGGEPTLHPELHLLIQYIDTFNIPFALFTNGLWSEPELIISIFQNSQHFIGFLVSLHGCTATAHTAFTENNPSSFEMICANIQRATTSGLEVFTNTVLTKFNCSQIDELIAISRKLGAGYAVFNRYLGQPHPLEPSEHQLREAITKIETLHAEGMHCRIGDCIPPCFIKNSSLGSNSGIEHCIISPKGDVRPDNLTSYTFGNIFEQSIEDIWQSEKANWYRAQVPEACLECLELPRCRGGCRSVTIEYGLEGDRLMKTPITEIQEEEIELHPDWKPFPNFTIREESFGYLLCRYDWSIPVTSDAKPLLDAINGNNTLAQLQEQFGESGLELLGHLYHENCLEFK